MQNILLPFGLIILTGVLSRRLRIGGLDPGSLRHAINVSVFNLFLPALCIKILLTSTVDIETVLVPVAAWVTTITGLLLALGVFSLFERPMHIDRSEKGVLVIASAFGNVTYLGLPVLTGLYGADSAKYALFYDLLATTPLLWLAGASIASWYGGGKRVRMAESLRTIASLPPVWGIAAGLLMRLSGVPIPSFLTKTLGMLGDLVVPLMIFSIGLALSLPKVKHAFAIIPALIIKLGVVPLVSYFAAFILGVRGIALASCLVEGAMPTMVLSLLIAAMFKLDESLAAFAIVVSTALSFITLPVAIRIAEVLVR